MIYGQPKHKRVYSKPLEKNAHTPPKLSTTSQKTPSTFLLANLLLKLFTTAKSILQLVTRQNTNGISTCHSRDFQIQT